MKKAKQQEIFELESQMLTDLENVYNNFELQPRTDLRELIGEAIEQIKETQDIDMVSALLCRQITKAYLDNRQNFPNSLIQLYWRIL
ncbi:bacteriocin immunity protein [Companilactobacillus suantsaicola]|uniref:Bacteriocin immunity protein n=1 Tax=Companilactobacillus suantsaicola TaxID=2487723 RepID=A0A4Z0JDB0_9LACO|nr:bacteriocin immunity protein [Companilactobacillus suantsaicola]TGD20770.1 bacteriocin immunity protein [Companilactobacillus suantsaicola]